MSAPARYLSRPRDLAAAAIQTDNPFVDIATLQRQMTFVMQYIHQYPTASAATVNGNMGTFTAGEIIMAADGSGGFPGDGFSGLYQTADQFEWPVGSGQYWNFMGFNNDVLEVGIDALTGRLLAAGGATIVGNDGISLSGLNYLLNFTATNGGATRNGHFGMIVGPDGTTPALAMLLDGGTAGSNLILNGDFEAGALTHWTDAGSDWAISSARSHGGTYSAIFTKVSAGSDTLTSDAVTVTGNTPYDLTGYYILYSDPVSGFYPPTLTLAVNWYSGAGGGGSLIRTDTVNATNTGSWPKAFGTFVSPSAALSAKVVATGTYTHGTNQAWIDDISLATSAGSTRQLAFVPDPTTIAGGWGAQELSSAPTSPLSGYLLSYADTNHNDRLLDSLGSDRVKWRGNYNKWGLPINVLVGSPATILSDTVKANAMGGHGYIYTRAAGVILNNSGASRGYSWVYNFGSYSFSYTDSAGTTNSATSQITYMIEVWTFNTSTSAQIHIYHYVRTTIRPAGTLGGASEDIWGFDTSAISTTADVAVSLQRYSSNATATQTSSGVGHMLGPFFVI